MCGYLPACLSVHYIYAVHTEAEEGVRPPRTADPDGCWLLYECWKTSLGSLEEQSVLLMLSRLFSPLPAFLFVAIILSQVHAEPPLPFASM